VVIRTYPRGSPTTGSRPSSARPVRGAPSAAVGRRAGRRPRHADAVRPPQAAAPAVRSPDDLARARRAGRAARRPGRRRRRHRAEWVTKTLVEHAPPGLAIEFVEQVEQRGTGDAMSVALTGCPTRTPGTTATWWCCRATRRCCARAPSPPSSGPPRQRRRRHLLTAVSTTDRLRPGGPRSRRRGRPRGRARRRHRRGARGGGGQHLDVLLQAERAGAVTAAPEPRQRPGRVLPDRRRRGALRRRTPRGVGRGRGHHGGRRRQRPAQLAVAEAELRDRINERWMRRGVTMWTPRPPTSTPRPCWPPTSCSCPASSSRRLPGG